MKIILTGSTLVQNSIDEVVVKLVPSFEGAAPTDSISGELFITTKPEQMLVDVGGTLVIDFVDDTEPVI